MLFKHVLGEILNMRLLSISGLFCTFKTKLSSLAQKTFSLSIQLLKYEIQSDNNVFSR